MRRGCRRFALGLLTAVLVVGAHQAARAQQTSTPPSPDEVAVTLHSYLAQNIALPPGWSPAGVSAYTPASLVYARIGHDAVGPDQELAILQNEGFIEAFGQNIYPSLDLHRQQGQSRVIAQVWAYDTAAQAQAALATPTNNTSLTGTPVPNAPSYGDGGTTITLTTLSLPASDLPPGLTAPTDEYRVRWTRGALLFDLEDYVVGGSAGSDTLAAFASAYDAQAVALGPFVAGAPQIPPPASEADRLSALERMGTVVLDPSAIPAGYAAPPPHLGSVADDILHAVGDPAAALAVEDTQWQRVISMAFTYPAPNAQSETLVVGVTEDATAAGADRDLHSAATNASANATIQMLPPPVQRGDDSVLWDTVFAPTASGTAEERDLVWRYGSVLLEVSVYGPQSTINETALENLAGWWDAAYQHSVYVTMPPAS